MQKLKVVLLASLALLAIVFLVAISTPYWFARKHDAVVDIHNPALIKKGAYLAYAADCAACHTAPHGRPFAGGLAMQTPMGTIYSTNITPDKKTGIGNYSYGDFERAVRRGVRPDGAALYPAMPYVSYAVVRDQDVKALYAYFMSSIKPVEQRNKPTTMPWPLSMRWPMALWQLMYARPRAFVPNKAQSPEVQRGAYLVEGLEHCGACHTPRGIAFQEKALHDTSSGVYLSGSALEGWYAKDLRNEGLGLAGWSDHEIVDFLATGRTDRTAAFGSMAEVISHSTQHLSDADLQAIAHYLKQLPARDGQSPHPILGVDTTTAKLRAGDYRASGATEYVEHCSECHRLDGRGAPRVFPALAGNSIVSAEDPSSLIQVTLAGGGMAKTPHDRMAFVMPGFKQLKNRDIADILNFIRNGWGNRGSQVKARDVARMRQLIDHEPLNYVPEAHND